MTILRRLLLGCAMALGLSVSLHATFSALCGTGTSCAYISGNKFGYQTAEQIRQNFNALVSPTFWTSTANADLTGETNLGALSTGLVKITVTGGTATPSSVTALPFTIYWPGAQCEAGGAYTANWAGDGVASPAATCINGSNVKTAALDFADSGTLYAHNQFKLPDDWTGALDLKVYWLTTATTGNVVWQVQTACVADNESVDPSFNTAQTITDAAKGTASRLNLATLSSVTTTGCAAGEELFFRLLRDPSVAGDTITATARLMGVELTYRRGI